MKLTTREKVLLALLALLAIVGLGAVFLLKPQVESLSAARKQKTELTVQKQTMEDALARYSVIDAQVENAVNAAKSAAENFYPESSSSQIEGYVTAYLNSVGLGYEGIAMSAPQVAGFSAYQRETNELTYDLKNFMGAGNSAGKAGKAQITNAVRTEVTVSVKGSYDAYVRLMDLIAKTPRSIYVNASSLDNQGGTVEGTVTFHVVSVAKIKE